MHFIKTVSTLSKKHLNWNLNLFFLNYIYDFIRQVLEEMEMLSAFTAVLHVPNLSKSDHLLAVLEESDVFTKQEVASIQRNIDGRRLV